MSPVWRIAVYIGGSLLATVLLSFSGNYLDAMDGESTLGIMVAATGAWTYALGVGVLTFWLHYHACRMTYREFVVREPNHPRHTLYAVICLAAMHLGQMTLWGVAMWCADVHMNLGEITGETEGAFIDYLNFSMATYTSLGLGDITPTDWLKVLTGVETLVGLLCIGWSASMFVGKMGQFIEEDADSA